MQTPKTRTNSSGVPQRTSPKAISSESSQKNSPKAVSSESSQKSSPKTISSKSSQKNSPQAAADAASGVSQKISPRVARELKTGSRYLDHTAASRASKETSPKVADHKSPKTPASQKKRLPRVSELESQISQLENDLKTVKDQLSSTEASKKLAQKDAEDSNQKLLILSEKLEESQKQLLDQSASEGIQNQHSRDDSAALATALDEIKQLKAQLETKAPSESAQHTQTNENELHKLKQDLAEANFHLEDMKKQLADSKEAEARAEAVVGETLMQLGTAKKTVESLKSGGLKSMEAYDAIASELDQSSARVSLLEELVSKLKAEKESKTEKRGNVESLETEFDSVKLENEHLKSALEAAEMRHNKEQALNTEQIQNALEMVEKLKSESSQREVELESELKKCKYEIEDLKANLMDKETELQGICEENEGFRAKLESMLKGQRELELEKEIENLKARLMQGEIEWRKMSEENEKLKMEINVVSKGKKGNDDIEAGWAAAREALMKINDMSQGDIGNDGVEGGQSAEQQGLMKIGYMKEEIEKTNKKAARVAEQLEAAQAVNAEMEVELRRLKVQSDQWRKAAEAAAAMVSANNGIMERTGSLDSNYNPRMGKMGSPYGDDDDDDLVKRKNGNVLRKFGVLWKTPKK